MANELSFSHGLPVSLHFELANPLAAATTDMVMSSVAGDAGFRVPTGYKFHPILLSIDSNDDLAAGTLTAKVTNGGTELVNGPEPVCEDAIQGTAAVARVGICPIDQGGDVGVPVTTTAAYLPVTCDYNAVLVGLLLPR